MVERDEIVSPFLRRGPGVGGMMAAVLACLTLSALHFGLRYDPGFLWRYAAYIAGGLLIEVVYVLLRDGRLGRPGWSTAVTTSLLVLSVPARMPWEQVSAGILVSVVFGKLMVDRDALRLNPMLLGRLFLMVVFADQVQDWALPGMKIDAITTATPLGLQAAAKASYDPVAILLGNVGGKWEGVYSIVPGSPGEVFPVLALACGVVLCLAGVLDWRPAAAFVLSFALACAVLGLPVGFHLAAGSVLFSAAYIVTDPRSMPGSKFGRYAAGAVAGIINAAIRNHGYYPEGIVPAVLAANLLSPTFDRLAFHARGMILAARARRT